MGERGEGERGRAAECVGGREEDNEGEGGAASGD